MVKEDLIIKKAKAGDREALGVLYESCFDALYKYVRFKVESNAVCEDIVSEAFIRAFENLARFRGDSSFKTYVYVIAKNLVFEHYKDKAKLVYLDEQMPEDEEQENGDLKKRGLLGRVREAMSLLKPKEREVIELRYFSRFSVEETSKTMGLTVSNVKVVAHRTLKILHSLLKEKNK